MPNLHAHGKADADSVPDAGERGEPIRTAVMHWLTLLPGGHKAVARPDQTLLQAAEAAGFTLPSSCRNGTCRTCLCHMGSGRIAYPVATWPGVSADERREGFVLPCVAMALTDVTIRHVGPSGALPVDLPDQ